jgi:hypothetical protein
LWKISKWKFIATEEAMNFSDSRDHLMGSRNRQRKNRRKNCGSTNAAGEAKEETSKRSRTEDSLAGAEIALYTDKSPY